MTKANFNKATSRIIDDAVATVKYAIDSKYFIAIMQPWSQTTLISGRGEIPHRR